MFCIKRGVEVAEKYSRKVNGSAVNREHRIDHSSPVLIPFTRVHQNNKIPVPALMDKEDSFSAW